MKININKILCPIDFSETSDHAVKYAIAMAQAHDAQIIMLHVIAPAIAALPGDQLIPNLPQADLLEIEDACQHHLTTVAGNLAELNLDISTRLVNGIPFLEIIKCAKDDEVDLLVMGTHGHTGLNHILIGSVAEKVVRKACCPVLTIKHPEHEFIMP